MFQVVYREARAVVQKSNLLSQNVKRTEFDSQISFAREKRKTAREKKKRSNRMRLHHKATKATKRFISAFVFDSNCYFLDSHRASSLFALSGGCTSQKLVLE